MAVKLNISGEEIWRQPDIEHDNDVNAPPRIVINSV